MTIGGCHWRDIGWSASAKSKGKASKLQRRGVAVAVERAAGLFQIATTLLGQGAYSCPLFSSLAQTPDSRPASSSSRRMASHTRSALDTHPSSSGMPSAAHAPTNQNPPCP